VPADSLIEVLAQHLKENVEEVSPPHWASFAKTGVHKERMPDREDWWYIRSASILRKLYIRGSIGVSRLRGLYGGGRETGVKPIHFKKGSGAIARNILHQLEAAKLVEKSSDGKGRALTAEGKRLLDRLAGKVKKEAERELPSPKK